MNTDQYMSMQKDVEKILHKRLFFIVGCQRSGTTWLQRSLDGHPKICCRGESMFVEGLLPGLKQSMNNYNQAQKAGDENTFSELDLDFLFSTEMALLFRHWHGASEAVCIGEKTPEHTVHMPLLDQAFPDSLFLHIIRDGRDAAVSGWFGNLRSAPERIQTRFRGRQHLYVQYMCRRHWVRYITAARHFGSAHPDRYLELRYEDMHANPEQVIRQLCAFLKVDCSPQSLKACMDAGSFQKLSGGRSPGQEDRNSFFRKGIVGDWREHLDEQSKAVFERYGGHLLRELGYPFL